MLPSELVAICGSRDNVASLLRFFVPLKLVTEYAGGIVDTDAKRDVAIRMAVTTLTRFL